MDTAELVTESFIIKIWNDSDGRKPAKWHGLITHVVTGEEFSFESIEDIESFMVPFLVELDAEEQSNWLKQACMDDEFPFGIESVFSGNTR